ncbi:MAG TPA: hypothetical protein VJ761_00520, partial [Ktedonobacteraceae bacterium]|nr:hypothetical protein [Ktedonobacteraceae bacterium]
PIPLRVLSFEHIFSVLDPTYSHAAVQTYAQILRQKFQSVLEERLEHDSETFATGETETAADDSDGTESVDALAVYKNEAIEALRNDSELMEQLRTWGKPWGAIGGFLERELPETLEDRHDIAFNLVREACEQIFGAENEGWHMFRRPSRKNKEGKYITWVKAAKS